MRRIILIVGCMLAASLAAYYGQPYAHQNSDVVTVMITVMTVFAGFLVAIMAVMGDPALLPEGSWRVVEHRREGIENRLAIHWWLFVLYMVAIGFLFVGVLLDKAPDATISEIWKIWIERLYLFFGITSFLLTFGLPKAIWQLQMARVDAEEAKRRNQVGLKD
jgi:hypothetical protein